jgi:exosortase E/protease (VPEID-CTERM system)
LWKTATALTFELAKVFLLPFVSTVTADPVTGTLGTQQFSVQIAPACSGLEGMGLMLIFGTLWLCFFHREYRYPRALLLIPVGMGLMFLLNSTRIAVLILIGNAGAPGVAMGGFHSQAGWLAFNAVALGLAGVAHRVPWISAGRAPVVRDDRELENPPAAYLVPLLAILAAAMISRATSGTFEWMYSLRFVAAGAALFTFRKKYSTLNWRFGWPAPAIGGLVFLLWIAFDRIAGVRAESTIAVGLTAMSPPARIVWLTCRILAAVATVPIGMAGLGMLWQRTLVSPGTVAPENRFRLHHPRRPSDRCSRWPRFFTGFRF